MMTTLPDFKPSQVNLAPISLVGTFNHSEAEAAATLLVRTMQVNGDKWQPILPKQIGTVMKADLASETDPIHAMNNNIFCGMDVDKLIKEGFARWTNPEMDRSSPVEFTEKGLARLREKWAMCGVVHNGTDGTCGVKIDHKGMHCYVDDGVKIVWRQDAVA